MNILVIGGAGYIGSHIVAELLEHGHSVTVFDNFSSGLRQNLFPQAAFVHGDIRSPRSLELALARGGHNCAPFDAVVHLAAFKAAGESMLVPEKYSVNNITGTVNILNAAVGASVKYFVFSSSAAVYGEPEYLPLDEKHPTRPTNYYGWTKLAIEGMLDWYGRLRGLRYASLRYFNAAGYDVRGRVKGLEQNPANLVPIIMETASGLRDTLTINGNDYNTPDHTCVRDYIHVNDLATAHRAALDYLEKGGESITVNLGTGKGVSILEALEAARAITGKPIPATFGPRRAGDPASLFASSKLAAAKLGWEARYSSLDTILRTTWAAYQAAKC